MATVEQQIIEHLKSDGEKTNFGIRKALYGSTTSYVMEVDRALQRLRKRGEIVYVGKTKTWALATVKTFDDAERFIDKLLTGTEDEFRLPLADARQLGGLLKDLLAKIKK